MSEPVRIIVYSNPAEAALWESGMAFPLFASIFIGFVVAYIVTKIWQLISGTKKSPYQMYREFTTGEMVVCLLAFISTTAYTLHRFGVF